jgi:hypothetical protein
MIAVFHGRPLLKDGNRAPLRRGFSLLPGLTSTIVPKCNFRPPLGGIGSGDPVVCCGFEGESRCWVRSNGPRARWEDRSRRPLASSPNEPPPAQAGKVPEGATDAAGRTLRDAGTPAGRGAASLAAVAQFRACRSCHCRVRRLRRRRLEHAVEAKSRRTAGHGGPTV